MSFFSRLKSPKTWFQGPSLKPVETTQNCDDNERPPPTKTIHHSSSTTENLAVDDVGNDRKQELNGTGKDKDGDSGEERNDQIQPLPNISASMLPTCNNNNHAMKAIPSIKPTLIAASIIYMFQLN